MAAIRHRLAATSASADDPVHCGGPCLAIGLGRFCGIHGELRSRRAWHRAPLLVRRAGWRNEDGRLDSGALLWSEPKPDLLAMHSDDRAAFSRALHLGAGLFCGVCDAYAGHTGLRNPFLAA